MLLASAALILALLQQVEESARAEPPLFQIETLLQAANHLPLAKYPKQRHEILLEIGRILLTIRHAESQALLTASLAAAWAPQDRAEALRHCQNVSADLAASCWDRLASALPKQQRALLLTGLRAGVFVPSALELITANPADGAEPLFLLMNAYRAAPTPAKRQLLAKAAVALAPYNSALAAEASELAGPPLPETRLKSTPTPPTPPHIAARMDRADEDATSNPERSRLFREVLAIADEIPDTQDRMMHQAAIAIWFAENGEEATAARAASLLHATFAASCKCEDIQCDSLEGRRECSDNIDAFVKLLREKKVDPAVLRLRHPSIPARNALAALLEALSQP